MIPIARFIGGGRRFIVEPLGSYTLGSIASGTGTQSSVDIGDPLSNRLIVIALGGHRGNTTTQYSAVTINGVSATLVAQAHQENGASLANTVIAYAIVPTGTSVDVGVTVSSANGMSDNHFSVFRLTGYLSSTPVHTNTGTGTSSPCSTTLNVNAGGFLVGVGAVRSGGANLTWTGLTDYSAENAGSGTMETAYLANQPSETSKSISFSDGSGTVARALSVASWR